jgi:hypothetical protein
VSSLVLRQEIWVSKALVNTSRTYSVFKFTSLDLSDVDVGDFRCSASLWRSAVVSSDKNSTERAFLRFIKQRKLLVSLPTQCYERDSRSVMPANSVPTTFIFTNVKRNKKGLFFVSKICGVSSVKSRVYVTMETTCKQRNRLCKIKQCYG